jgi:6-phospho-beta-glucosidase
MKLAVIGAGSTYTPELVSGLLRDRERVDLQELVLHDIDPERREVVGGLAARMLERQGYAGSLEITGDLDRALDGAAFVLIQIRVGGQAARLQDETIPAACGCVGQETTGAGGLAKALRTVPVVLDIAERARELAASDAWIIDFTNPVGIVTRALLDAGHRAVGLCNVAISFQRQIAAALGVSPERVQVDQVGLNHLTWIRAVRLDGRDVLRDVLDTHGDALAQEVGLPRRLFEELGAIPSYYLRYFYSEREVLQEQRMTEPRARTVAKIEQQLLEMYRDPNLAEKPALLVQRGGAFYSEAALQLVASLAADGGEVQVVDVRNRGTLAGLADDDVVEVPARVHRDGAVPLAQRPLAPELLGLVQHVAAYERLAAWAARTRDMDDARLALLANPLVREWKLADGLVERLLTEPPPGYEPGSPAKRGARIGRAPGQVVLAVDGGNVKTDLALVDDSGELLSLVRGGRSSPHYLGIEGCVDMLHGLLSEAASRAGLNGNLPRLATAQIMIAGADLPEELFALRGRIESLSWAQHSVVDNDTFALLRSGTDRGWGVAVVCGGGTNCVGVAPDGRQVRFPSLGSISGDWGGGDDVGLAALIAAARSEDGRGPRTVLEQLVPAYFKLADPVKLSYALHLRELPRERLGELARVVFAVAEDDPVAAEIVDRLADEVIAFAVAALRRLELTDAGPDVVLGGGLLRAAPASAIERVRRGVREVAASANVVVPPTAPIVGAALLGLDELGVTSTARERAVSELHAAFLKIEGDGARPAHVRIAGGRRTEPRLARSSRG